MVNNNITERKSTDAQIKASAKYGKSHYKTMSVRFKIGDYAQIADYANKNNVSINKLINNCIIYCMEHGVQFNDNNLDGEDIGMENERNIKSDIKRD